MAAIHGAQVASGHNVWHKVQHQSSNAKWLLVALLIASVVAAIFVGLIAGGVISTAMLSAMWIALQNRVSLKIVVGIGLSLVLVSSACIGLALHRKKDSSKQLQLDEFNPHPRNDSDNGEIFEVLESYSIRPNMSAANPENEVFSDDNWPKPKPYEGVGFRALQGARDCLSRATIKFESITEVEKLSELLEKDWFIRLKSIIVQNPQEPWKDSRFVSVATQCMRISYAISSLVLDDIGPRFMDNGGTGKIHTHFDVLKEHYYGEFFECPTIYSMLRGGVVLAGDRLSYAQSLPQEYVENFSKEHEQQKEWRDLYNDYCERVRYYFKDSLKDNADKRYFNCSQIDPGQWVRIDLVGERYKVTPSKA